VVGLGGGLGLVTGGGLVVVPGGLVGLNEVGGDVGVGLHASELAQFVTGPPIV
jgi:hypothetical protein